MGNVTAQSQNFQSSSISFTADSLTSDQWKSEKKRAGIPTGSAKFVDVLDPEFDYTRTLAFTELPQLQKADASVGKHISAFRKARANLNPEVGQADLYYYRAIQALIGALDGFLAAKDFSGPAAEDFKSNVLAYKAEIESLRDDPTIIRNFEIAHEAASKERDQFHEDLMM